MIGTGLVRGCIGHVSSSLPAALGEYLFPSKHRLEVASALLFVAAGLPRFGGPAARRPKASFEGGERTSHCIGLLNALRPPQPRWLNQIGKGVSAAPARNLGCQWSPSYILYLFMYICRSVYPHLYIYI